MANPIIRPFPMYFKGKKVAEINEGTYTVASGDEMQFGAEGYLGHSDGATTTKIDATLVVPVKGISVTMLQDMINKKYVTVGIFADGKMQQTDYRCVSIEYSWDTKSGKAAAKASFEGGQPDLAG